MLVFFKWRFFFLQVNLGEEADGGEERCQLISLGTPGEGRPVASPRKEQSNTLLCLGRQEKAGPWRPLGRNNKIHCFVLD